MKTTLKEL